VTVDAYGHVLSTTNPTAGAAAWRLAVAAEGEDGLMALSCPSLSLCAGIDDAARLVTSIDPGSPHATWHVTTLPGLANAYEWGITCARRPLCVVYDRGYESTGGHYQRQRAFASIDPDGGVGAWRALHLPGFFVGTLPETVQTSCPWRRLCITWRNLAGQPTALLISARTRSHHHLRHPQTYLPYYKGTSCPTSSFCVGPGLDGDVLISTRPTGGRRAWRAEHIDDATPTASFLGHQAEIEGVSCPTRKLCVAFDDGGSILSSTHPSGGPGAWKLIHLSDSADLRHLSCPSVSLCVAVDEVGNILTSTQPTGDSSTWTATAVDTSSRITSLACPSTRLCLAGDQNGNILLGTRPVNAHGRAEVATARHASAWSSR
jgi:hypothetical protein